MSKPLRSTGFMFVGSDEYHLYVLPKPDAIREAIETLQVALKHAERKEAAEAAELQRIRSILADKDGKFAGTIGGAALRQLAECILSGNKDNGGGA